MAQSRKHTDSGASSAEYAVLVACIAAVIVLAVALFGGAVSNLFSDTCDQVRAHVSSSC